jgi:hypothetical protein
MTVDISHFFTYLVCSRDAFVIYPCSFNKRTTIIYSNRRHTATTEKTNRQEAAWEIVARKDKKKFIRTAERRVLFACLMFYYSGESLFWCRSSRIIF